jgi:hypothetical protein
MTLSLHLPPNPLTPPSYLASLAPIGGCPATTSQNMKPLDLPSPPLTLPAGPTTGTLAWTRGPGPEKRALDVSSSVHHLFPSPSLSEQNVTPFFKWAEREVSSAHDPAGLPDSLPFQNSSPSLAFLDACLMSAFNLHAHLPKNNSHHMPCGAPSLLLSYTPAYSSTLIHLDDHPW